MENPAKVEYRIPNNCCTEVEILSIWTQTYEHYSDLLTQEQLVSSVNWFKDFIESKNKANK